MKKRKTLFWGALIISLSTITLLVTGSPLLTIYLDNNESVPLGNIITWVGMMALPLSIFWGLRALRNPTGNLNAILAGVLKAILVLAILWLPVAYFLAGNWSFTFSESASFRGGQLAMKLFWYLSFGIGAGAIVPLLIYWLSLLFRKNKTESKQQTLHNSSGDINPLILWGFLSLLPLFFSCQSESVDLRPNILFVSIDDLRPTLGVYDDPDAITPNLDQFASEGITFRQTYCQAAVCAPSRASLMTGRRPDAIRVWHLGDQFRKINPDIVTMPQYFHQFGYHTVNIGKIFHNYMPDSVSWDEPDLRPERYKRPDWLKRDGETFYISKTVQQQQVIKRDSLLKLKPVRYADGWNTGPAWEAADVHDTMYYDGAQTILAKQTLTRLAEMDRPFFMGLGFFRPHLPFTVPKKYWDLYDRDQLPLASNPDIPEGAPIFTMNSMYELRHYDHFGHIGHPTDYRMSEDTARILKHGYYASVSYVDALFGQLLAHLKSLGIYENTIIVVWGDHGWKLGDHNSWGKMTNYNIDLHVPLLIRYPGQKKRGVQTFALTELVDLFPSLCELAGIKIPENMEGTSLVPLMEAPEKSWKSAAFSQFHRRPKVSKDGNRYMGYSINTSAHHYIEWYTWDHLSGTHGALVSRELYDKVKDPGETINLAIDKANEQLIEDLSGQLAAGWQKALPD